MKQFFKYILVFVFLNISCPVIIQAGDSGQYRWAFFHIDKGGDVRSIEWEKINTGQLNNDVKIFFRPIRNAYLYLLLFDPNDNLTILFPDSFDVFKKKYFTFEKHIPSEGYLSDRMKEPGEYELHLLVAEKRLNKLEQLISEHREMEHGKNSSYKKMKITNELLSEINRIKRKHLFPDKIKRSFVDEAGSIRTDPGAVLRAVEDIEFDELYTEIFLLELPKK